MKSYFKLVGVRCSNKIIIKEPRVKIAKPIIIIIIMAFSTHICATSVTLLSIIDKNVSKVRLNLYKLLQLAIINYFRIIIIFKDYFRIIANITRGAGKLKAHNKHQDSEQQR